MSKNKKTKEELDIEYMKDYIYYCAEKLDEKFDFSFVEDVCWIVNYDEGEDYCYDCCVKEVEELNKEREKKSIELGDNAYEDVFVDGGWSGVCCSGSGSPAVCEKCGKLLDYFLCESGVEDETDHFLSYGVKDIDNREAFKLYRIFDDFGSCYIKEEKTIKKVYRLAVIVAQEIGVAIKNRFEIIDI